jgi:hypothetical protein
MSSKSVSQVNQKMDLNFFIYQSQLDQDTSHYSRILNKEF